MKCPNCGAKLREGAQFCPKCGTKLEGPVKGSVIRPQYIITGAVILAIAGIGIGTYLFNSKDDGKEEVAVADQEQTEVATDANTEENIAADDIDTKEELLSNFGLSESNVADYSSAQVLDYTQYNHYDSGIGNFKFGYPTSLYNDVSVVNEQEGGTYGTILHQVNMSGTDGSTASFTLYKNEINAEDKSVEGMTRYVFDTEKDNLFTPSVQINGVSNDGLHGTIIMTGYVDGQPNTDCAYTLCRVESDYVYQMKFSYPRPLSEDDDKNKAYFSDVMYRLCGFSGTSRSTPDTYEAFIDRCYTNFTLADWQKEILQGVVEYLVNMKNTSEWGMGTDYDPVFGDMKDMAGGFYNDHYLLEMYFYGGAKAFHDYVPEDFYESAWVDFTNNGKRLTGALDFERTFFRDLFDMELGLDQVRFNEWDAQGYDHDLYMYEESIDEIVLYAGDAGGNPGGFMYDGPDDWNYNDELDCFDYHYGPVYDIYADESWKEHRDAKEPGYGIYVAHIRPYNNNSLGFKLLGIERVE